MISWGTKFDAVGEYNNVLEEECKICSERSKPIYKLEQGYFNLYGLSLFPSGKTIYKTCQNCNTRLKAKKNDNNLDAVTRALPGKLKFKYVWGWIILLPILIGITLLVLEIKKME